MANIELKFRRFDDLLNEILIDMRVLDEEGMIEPSQLIKVAQRVNYDLGLKIHQTREIILDVDNNVARLPDDFYTLNFAMLTGRHKVLDTFDFGGRVTEQSNTSCSGDTCCLTPLTYDSHRLNSNMNYQQNPCLVGEADPWFQRKCFSICGADNCVKVIDHRRHEIREYSWFDKLDVVHQNYKDPGTMNSRSVKCHTAEIKNGYLYVHTQACCHVYLSYQGALVDDQNNLLVLDHPEVNFYYESALKEHIFKTLWYSGGEEIKIKYDEARQETRENRVRALSIVNTPDFKDMQNVFRANRQAQYTRYYRTFESGVFNSWFRTLPF